MEKTECNRKKRTTKNELQPEDNADRASRKKNNGNFQFPIQKLREATAATRPTTPSRAPPGIKLVLDGGREAAHLRGIHAEGSVDICEEGARARRRLTPAGRAPKRQARRGRGGGGARQPARRDRTLPGTAVRLRAREPSRAASGDRSSGTRGGACPPGLTGPRTGSARARPEVLGTIDDGERAGTE